MLLHQVATASSTWSKSDDDKETKQMLGAVLLISSSIVNQFSENLTIRFRFLIHARAPPIAHAWTYSATNHKVDLIIAILH